MEENVLSRSEDDAPLDAEIVRIQVEQMIGLAGDWHGNFQWQKAALREFGEAGIKTIFHVGDYGVAWPGKWPYLLDSAQAICEEFGMTLYITPGNHENWEWINSRKYEHGMHWMSPNVCLLERNALFHLDHGTGSRLTHSFGGAASIDYQWRLKGIDWFPEELPSYADVMLARELGEKYDVEIMIAHDSPDGATDRVQAIIDNPDFSMWSPEGLAYAAQGRGLMNHAFGGIKPKVFVHGHFHATDVKQTDETLFISLGCDGQDRNIAVLDLDDLTMEWMSIDYRKGA